MVEPVHPCPRFREPVAGSLTDAQVKLLADGVKSHWSSEAPLQQTPPAYAVAKREGLKSTPEDRTRRMEIYQRACAGCHGPNGAGGEGSHSRVGADQRARLSRANQRSGPSSYHHHRPARSRHADVRRKTRPLGRLSAHSSSAEIDDLVALLAEWRSAGNIDLAERH